MIRKFNIVGILLICFLFSAFSQNTKYDQSDQAIEARLKKDVGILASDSLSGREAGTEGEIMARNYIVAQFKEIGLQPLFGGNSYLQSFDVNGGARFGANTLIINKNMFNFKKDFFPMDFSSNDTIKAEVVKVKYGIAAPELNYDDYKKLNDIRNEIFVMELNLSDSLKKIAGFEKYLDPKQRAVTAIEKGAKGIIFINSNASGTSNPPQILSGNTKLLSVPVLFADKKAARMIKVATNMKAEIEVNVKRKKCEPAYNIGGFIDNKAKFTVVFGAHYDHLGFTTSSYGKKIVSNGADDNASGTAAIMELARHFSDTTEEKYNLVFLAFSAEEKGLYGSEYFVESNAIDLSKVAFMINCDMIGRLDSVKKEFAIYCAGSSPAWAKIIEATDAAGLKINKKDAVESGSDHYNFYLKNIPAVFFFTGFHSDYHKPSDDVWKVKFNGETQIVKYIERFFNAVKGNKKLPFTRTTSTW